MCNQILTAIHIHLFHFSSDAAKVHLDIAEHIERKYFNNLAPFYAR